MKSNLADLWAEKMCAALEGGLDIHDAVLQIQIFNRSSIFTNEFLKRD